LRAFKGRTRGGGAGKHLVLIAQQELGIGAHVHDQNKVFGLVWGLRQGYGGSVRAHMPGNARQDVNAGIRVEFEVLMASRTADVISASPPGFIIA